MSSEPIPVINVVRLTRACLVFDRPNPIGLHPVKVLEVEDLRIRVNHMEAIDGTPSWTSSR